MGRPKGKQSRNRSVNAYFKLKLQDFENDPLNCESCKEFIDKTHAYINHVQLHHRVFYQMLKSGTCYICRKDFRASQQLLKLHFDSCGHGLKEQAINPDDCAECRRWQGELTVFEEFHWKLHQTRYRLTIDCHLCNTKVQQYQFAKHLEMHLTSTALSKTDNTEDRKEKKNIPQLEEENDSEEDVKPLSFMVPECHITLSIHAPKEQMKSPKVFQPTYINHESIVQCMTCKKWKKYALEFTDHCEVAKLCKGKVCPICDIVMVTRNLTKAHLETCKQSVTKKILRSRAESIRVFEQIVEGIDICSKCEGCTDFACEFYVYQSHCNETHSELGKGLESVCPICTGICNTVHNLKNHLLSEHRTVTRVFKRKNSLAEETESVLEISSTKRNRLFKQHKEG